MLIFDNAIPYQELPVSDPELKEYLNYNPTHSEYTRRQNLPCRPPNETDRGGWRGYDRVYSKYFKDIRYDKLQLLEIGIMEGYGLLAWQRYFPNAKVTGVDENFNAGRLRGQQTIAQNYPIFKLSKKYYFDSTTAEGWETFYGREYDIIIDDGGHHPDTQRQTLKNAWKYCKSGGLYFIEDIGHRYGKAELQRLSDDIRALSDEFETIEIYSHENEGLHFLFNEPIITEYIVAIRKK